MRSRRRAAAGTPDRRASGSQGSPRVGAAAALRLQQLQPQEPGTAQCHCRTHPRISANNRIAGANGKDILTGGGDTGNRDVFVFIDRSDCLLLDPISTTVGYYDKITDFNSNERIAAPFSVETDLLTASIFELPRR